MLLCYMLYVIMLYQLKTCYSNSQHVISTQSMLYKLTTKVIYYVLYVIMLHVNICYYVISTHNMVS